MGRRVGATVVIVRSLPTHGEEIFLTFDDGPEAGSTEAVLDLLAAKDVRATFFLISQKAARRPDLVERIREGRHAIGNHSPDHAYRNFFKPARAIREWIERAEQDFSTLGVHDVVGFRPPAGVVNRHLQIAAGQMNLPVILWNERFYDVVVPWGPRRARASAARLTGGSIVLLHDRVRPARVESFCSTLGGYIDQLRARGFRFSPLERGMFG